MPKGLKRIGFDRLPWKKSLPTGQRRNPSSPLAGTIPSTVEFWVAEGIVELRDPRLFRDGQDRFCLALVEQMVRPGLAQRVEIRRTSATCRIEFEPGEHGRDKLASKVASALKATTLATMTRPTDSSSGDRPTRWMTLNATATRSGPAVWETGIDANGEIIRRPRPAVLEVKPESMAGRPLHSNEKRIRVDPPQSRPTIQSGDQPPIEPIGLAVGPESILGRDSAIIAPPSAAESKRLIHLALAGGSFAMAVAGVILPGIPALPFVLLTGHYLVRSSPKLCRRLEIVPGMGGLLEKARKVGGQSIHRRSLWKMFVLTVAAVAALVILHPPLPVVILLETGLLVYFGLREFCKPAGTALSSHLGSTQSCWA